MPQCVTCGRDLHPERAEKYSYCMAPECQEKNAKSLTVVAVGVNKAAEQYMILDDHIREELASGKYHDQRRGSFGPAERRSRPQAAAGAAAASGPARRPSAPAGRRASRDVSRRPWSRSQEKLTLLYNEQRLRPEEIAQKLGLSTYMVTQIILAARNQGML
jgi:Fe-S cluster biosynthesis and repair protein YggX